MSRCIFLWCGLVLFHSLDALCVYNTQEHELRSIVPVGAVRSSTEWQKMGSNKLRFDPVLEVNQNRGSFSTSIPIELPPSLVGWNGLALSYQSHNAENQGLGVGWNWSLPKILKNVKAPEKSPFLTVGLLGSHELVATGETIEPIREELHLVQRSVFGPAALPFDQVRVFRPLLDQNGISFIQLFSNNQSLGWIAMTTDGGRWVFSSEGLPLSVLNLRRQQIQFHWETGLLTVVRERHGELSSWEMQLTYTEQKRPWPSWTVQGWETLPLGLQQIQIGPRILDFVTDDEGFLLRAGWRGGVQPIFQGVYTSPRLTLRTEVNPFSRHDDQVPHRLNLEDPLSMEMTTEGGVTHPLKVDHNPDFKNLYVDLSGSGRNDRIRFDLRSQKAFFERMKAACHPAEYQGGFFCDQFIPSMTLSGREQCRVPKYRVIDSVLQDWNTSSGVSEVQVAVSDGVDARANWRRDESLQLPAEVRLADYKMTYHPYFGDRYCDRLVALPHALFFIDLYHRGQKDLIDCGADDETLEPALETEADPIRLEGMYSEAKRTHSNFILSVLELTQPDLVTGKNFNHVFRSKGKDPLVYLQKTKDEYIRSVLTMDGNASFPSSSRLMGSREWVKLEKPGFKCNSSSLFLDLNHDGKISVLTGNKLYLASDEMGKYQEIEVDPREFFGAADARKDPSVEGEVINFQDTNLTLSDHATPGKYVVRQARSVVVNPLSGLIEIVKDRQTDLVTPAPRAGKLLTQVLSPWGGRVDIDYQFNQGVWAPHEITKRPFGAQAESRVSYTYFGPIHDPFRGYFIGFSKTQERLTVADPRVAPRVTQNYYYQDLSPAATLFLSRARINGNLLLTKQVHPEDETMVYRETSFLPTLHPAGNNRVLMLSYETKDRLFNGERDAGGKPYIVDQKVTTRRIQRDGPDWVFDSSGNRILPLKETIEEVGMGLRSHHSDQLLKTRKVIHTERAYFPRKGVVRPIGQVILDKEDVKVRADQRVQYDPETLAPISSCEGARCSEFHYDDLGRLVGMRKSNGYAQTLAYPDGDAFPLPTAITFPEGTERKTYDPLTGDLTSLMTSAGALYSLENTIDGVLYRVMGQRQLVSPPVLYFERFGGRPPECDVRADYCRIPNQVAEQSLDQIIGLQLDGFGRLEASTGRSQGREVHYGTARYGIGDEVISRTEPRFGNLDSGVFSYENQLNFLGQTIWERKGREGAPGTWESQWTHSGPCHEERKNGHFVSSNCTNLFGQVETQRIGSEQLGIESTAGGDLLGVPSLGIKWRNNAYGEALFSSAGFQNADPTFLQGAAEWGHREARLIEERRDGMEVVDPFGFSKRFNSSGQLITARRSERLGGAGKPTDTQEDRRYHLGNLAAKEFTSLRSGGRFLNISYEHDSMGELTALESFGLKVELSRDDFGRTLGWKLSRVAGAQTLVEFSHLYQDGKVSGINQVRNGRVSPLISEVERDVLGRVTQYKIGNDLVVKRKYQGQNPQMLGVSAKNARTGAFWKEKLIRDPMTHEVIRRAVLSSLTVGAAAGGAGEEAPARVEEFAYNPENYHLTSVAIDEMGRDSVRSSGFVERVGANRFEWNGENLASAVGRRFYYDGDGQWIASCPEGVAPENPRRCIYRIDNDILVYEGKLSSLIRLDGIPVAALQEGKVYPIIADHLGSIRAQWSTDGSALRWERYYGAWGEKQVQFNSAVTSAGTDEEREKSRAHEQGLLWSYAGLMELPGVKTSETMPLYWSQSRVYSAVLHEWMSVDPAVKWNPQQILAQPGNWHAVRYAAGNPLEFVDPTGKVNFVAGYSYSAVLGMGVEGGGGVYFNPGLFGQERSTGLTGSLGGGTGLNISAGAYAGVVFGDSSNVYGHYDAINLNLDIGFFKISGSIFLENNFRISGISLGIGGTAIPLPFTGSVSSGHQFGYSTGNGWVIGGSHTGTYSGTHTLGVNTTFDYFNRHLGGNDASYSLGVDTSFSRFGF